MKCSECDAFLTGYEFSELSQSRTEEVNRHLADCPKCRKILQNYREAGRALGCLKEATGMPGLKDSVMSSIDAKQKAPAGAGRVGARRRLYAIMVKTAIPAVVIALLALYFAGVFRAGNDFLSKVAAATEKVPAYVATHTDSTGGKWSVSYNAPEIYDFKMTFFDQEQELFDDANTFYVKTPEITGPDILELIYKITSQRLYNSIPSKENTLSTLGLLTGLNQLQDEEVGGVECFHYTGTVDNAKFIKKAIASLDKNTPGYQQLVQGLKAEEDTTSQQVELWVGESDYLIRRMSTEFRASSPFLLIYGEDDYSYPEVPALNEPLDASGTTLPGWYLVSSPSFSSSINTSVSDAEKIIDVQISLTNVTAQTFTNVRVFASIPPIGVVNWLIFPEDAQATPSMSPGGTETYDLQFPYSTTGGDISGIVKQTTTVFVEFTSSGGMNMVQSFPAAGFSLSQ